MLLSCRQVRGSSATSVKHGAKAPGGSSNTINQGQRPTQRTDPAESQQQRPKISEQCCLKRNQRCHPRKTLSWDLGSLGRFCAQFTGGPLSQLQATLCQIVPYNLLRSSGSLDEGWRFLRMSQVWPRPLTLGPGLGSGLDSGRLAMTSYGGGCRQKTAHGTTSSLLLHVNLVSWSHGASGHLRCIFAFICYVQQDLWHERLVLAWVNNTNKMHQC